MMMKTLKFMCSICILIIAVLIGSCNSETVRGNSSTDTETPEGPIAGKTLVAYFSWSGNTRTIAQTILGKTRADIFEIQTVTPYSTNYSEVLTQAQNERNGNARLPLSTHVADMAQYEVIFIGYPIWHGSIPMAVVTFLEEYDFTGKTIVPFCSSASSGPGSTRSAIANLAPNSQITEILSVYSSGGNSLSNDISAWLQKIGVTEQ
jgi:flavodoxin